LDEVRHRLDNWNEYDHVQDPIEEQIRSINSDNFDIAIIDPKDPGGSVHIVVGCDWIYKDYPKNCCYEVNGRVREDDEFMRRIREIDLDERRAKKLLEKSLSSPASDS